MSSGKINFVAWPGRDSSEFINDDIVAPDVLEVGRENARCRNG